ncbi:MAG TPA: DUF1801 domain-containing protein [Terriglobales bacterium]|nr:DUF1801 domain-containing protein [Terriglobales bacterium]
MKKAAKKKSSRHARMSGPDAPKTVDQYLAHVPEPARSTLEKVRAIIRAAAPKETTEKISYGMPTFHYKRSLVALGAFKDHCSLFPMGSSVLTDIAEEIKPYQVSKGTLHFPIDKPMPAALVTKIVKLRVAQNEKQR